ncbi:UPF0536 protein C12orf66-like [Stylophora pistillata]|uniref:UPF0536 protein C12orf66-like n=1 Tax=Stylophora pistillata TaxID=50429 RepID=A0A2B4RH01_STYPI|nr:UPF0536 protein C12orf66-like [Stylophora pistillata]
MLILRSKYPDLQIPDNISWPDFVFSKFDKYGDRAAIVSILREFELVILIEIKLTEHVTFVLYSLTENANYSYEAMAMMGSATNVKYTDLSNMIDEICQRHSKGFHHPILDSLKSSFSYEVEILSNLLKAQCDMADWKFLPSLLHLHESYVKLSSWCQFLPPGEFTLYFYNILERQTTPIDMKSVISRASADYVGRIMAFIRRSDAFSVNMLLDTHQLEQYQGHGYHLPFDIKEKPSGLGAFPAIFSFPGSFSFLPEKWVQGGAQAPVPEQQLDRPVGHWPNIVSILLDKVHELNTMEKIVFFFDNRVQSTYFLTRVDPRLTLVVIFNSKRSEKDSYVTTFLTETATLLRNTKVFAMLKQGGKN